MPKSKRNKQVELSKSRKKGLDGRKQLYNEIRSCVDTYTHLFIFSVSDMRNSKMKKVRHQWGHSRFFIGKNKVMAIALGRTPEEEYRPSIHKIAENLKGERGLLFSNQPVEEVVSWFQSFSEGDFARSGNIATEDVSLSEGPLPYFPHSLESYLRQLGLPTTLNKGVVHLVKDHVVCKEGDVLNPETARILKLLEYQMAEFRVKIECVWSQDGTFLNLNDSKENMELEGDSQQSITKATNVSKETISSESDGDGEMKVAETDADDESLNSKPSENDVEIINSPKDSNEIALPESDSEDEKIPTLVEIVDIHSKKEEDIPDRESVLKITKQKVKEVETTPPKYSPKMTRARAAASAKKKPKTPEEREALKKTRRSRAVNKDV